MKKSSFIDGAIIVTIGLIVCKILGIIYVIPFRAIVGTKGGELYSYAYSIYSVFVSISSSGIPLAISKMVSEYYTLGYYHTKEKVFKIGNCIICILGLLCFLILFLFAPQISYLIIGDVVGGNSKESITMVVRIISTSLLFVPILSVYKGYLQGHKIMNTPSISSVIEQFIRVLVIILGSFFALKVFHLKIDTAVGIAVFGATLGAMSAYFYLLKKVKENRAELKRGEPMIREESKITTRFIIKKILFYAIPFIIIDAIRSAYYLIDTFTVVRALNNLGYDVLDAENAVAVITTWGSKLNMIVISISVGIATSLTPNIVSSFVKKNLKDVNAKINQTLQILFLVITPMTVGLMFLAGPVWNVFYGYDVLSISLFKLYVFQALTYSIFFILSNTAQVMNYIKIVLGTLIVTFLAKWFLNVPLMNLFHQMKIPAYYAPVVSTLLIQLLGSLILLIHFHKTCKTNYAKTVFISIKIFLANAVMYMGLLIVAKVIPLNPVGKFLSILEIVFYAFLGITIYLYAVYKARILKPIFGTDPIKNFFDHLRIDMRNKKGL